MSGFFSTKRGDRGFRGQTPFGRTGRPFQNLKRAVINLAARFYKGGNYKLFVLDCMCICWDWPLPLPPALSWLSSGLCLRIP